MRGLRRFLLIVLLAACSKSDGHHLRGVSVQIGNAAAQGQMLYTLTATLPDGLEPDDSWQRPTLVDSAGMRHQCITSSTSRSSNGPAVFGATFEIPEDRRDRVVEVGKYSIDFSHGLITERR